MNYTFYITDLQISVVINSVIYHTLQLYIYTAYIFYHILSINVSFEFQILSHVARQKIYVSHNHLITHYLTYCIPILFFHVFVMTQIISIYMYAFISEIRQCGV